MPNPFIPITNAEDKWKSKAYSHRAVDVFICPLCGWDLKITGINQASDLIRPSEKKHKWAHYTLRCGMSETCKFEIKIYFRKWKQSYTSRPMPMTKLQKYKIHKKVRTLVDNKWESMNYYNKCFSMNVCPECGEKLILSLTTDGTGFTYIPRLRVECSHNFVKVEDTRKRVHCSFLTTAIITLEVGGLIYARLAPNL